VARVDVGGDGGEQVDDRVGRGPSYRGEQPVEGVGGDDVRAGPRDSARPLALLGIT
jgi:hypothetical protein